MALVSEQVGASEFQQFRQSVESFLLGALGIVSEKTHQFGYTDEAMNGTKALLKHIRSGKDVRMQLVEEKDASLFASILKHNSIPYAEVAERTEGSGRHVFLTRDSDSAKLDEVWKQYAYEIGKDFLGSENVTVGETRADEKQRVKKESDIKAVERRRRAKQDKSVEM